VPLLGVDDAAIFTTSPVGEATSGRGAQGAAAAFCLIKRYADVFNWRKSIPVVIGVLKKNFSLFSGYHPGRQRAAAGPHTLTLNSPGNLR
jgi:hypothetical protein